MCKLFGISPTPSDESIDEKGATPSHQFNNVECDRGWSEPQSLDRL